MIKNIILIRKTKNNYKTLKYEQYIYIYYYYLFINLDINIYFYFMIK